MAVEKVYFTESRPIFSSKVSDTPGPVEIVVSGSGAEYIHVDLKRSRLYVKARILKADGTALATSEKTGIVSLPLQSMFSQMGVYLNNKLVSFNTNSYPWKAYLKTVLFGIFFPEAVPVVFLRTRELLMPLTPTMEAIPG